MGGRTGRRVGGRKDRQASRWAGLQAGGCNSFLEGQVLCTVASRQASRQAGRRAGKQTGGRAGKQAGGQEGGQAGGQAGMIASIARPGPTHGESGRKVGGWAGRSGR